MKKYLLLSVFLSIGIFLSGQVGQTDAWYSYGGAKKVDDNWNIQYLMQFRSNALKPTPGMFFILGGVNYHLPDRHWKVGMSYYLIEKKGSNPDLELYYEAVHFIRQEVAYQYHWGNLKISHKLRLEQVWGHQVDLFQQMRWVNGVNLPISRDQKFYLNAYSELFYRYNGTGYNRNRVFAGVQYRVTQPLSIQIGYLSEMFEHRTSKNLFIGIHQSL